jgi:hopanoid biosynthesis associated protein HpnK
MKGLIVNADDFGLTPGVNRAIIEAHTQGIVTSTTLMANMPAFAEAVELARAQPRLGVGLHFNITQGRPVAAPSKVPSLLNAAGEFLGTSTKLARRSWLGQLNPEDVRRELCAQLEKLAATGLTLTHLDGHQHAHAWPAVLRVIEQTLADYNIHAVRVPREQVRWSRALSSPKRFKQSLTASGLRWLCRSSVHALAAAQLRTPAAFFGVAQTGIWSRAWLLDLLDHLPEGVSELMCHPGYADAELRQTGTRLSASREAELRLLTAPEIQAAVRARKVELLHFGQLKASF